MKYAYAVFQNTAVNKSIDELAFCSHGMNGEKGVFLVCACTENLIQDTQLLFSGLRMRSREIKSYLANVITVVNSFEERRQFISSVYIPRMKSEGERYSFARAKAHIVQVIVFFWCDCA